MVPPPGPLAGLLGPPALFSRLSSAPPGHGISWFQHRARLEMRYYFFQPEIFPRLASRAILEVEGQEAVFLNIEDSSLMPSFSNYSARTKVIETSGYPPRPH